jgi:hypothetical protein
MNRNGAMRAELETREYRAALLPFASARERWRNLVKSSPRASLYHSERWIDLLSQVYNLCFDVAQIDGADGRRAACVFARSRSNPLRRRMVALPFSDNCPPLGEPDACAKLLGALASMQPRLGAMEVRGIAATNPWTTLHHFGLWTLNLQANPRILERGLSVNFRRNVKKALRQTIRIERGLSVDLIKRFYRLNLESRSRLGLPAQPLRFFRAVGALFRADADIWIASSAGRDLATVFLLSDGPRLYSKWIARGNSEVPGVGHLLLWSIIEASAGRFDEFDLGRTDQRNHGLVRFKQEMGARAVTLPSSFLPCTPRLNSSEYLSGASLVLSCLWKRLPLPLARVIGGAIYGLLS